MNFDHTFMSVPAYNDEEGCIFIHENAHEICKEGVRFMSNNPTSSMVKMTPHGKYHGYPFEIQRMRWAVETKLTDVHNMTEIHLNAETGMYEKVD
jgi:hypothetical protein